MKESNKITLADERQGLSVHDKDFYVHFTKNERMKN